MDIQEHTDARGELTLVVTGPDGVVKETHNFKNLVVTTGKNYIASRMVDASATVMNNMAIGTGTTAAVVGDATLGTEAGRVTLTGFTSATNNVTASATFPAGTGTGAITEAGIFNAASAGAMLCRTVFPVVNKAAADSISITWVVTIG